MPYEDIELKTPDGVLLRCYALVQRKRLSETHQDAMFVDDDFDTEEEVRLLSSTHIVFFRNLTPLSWVCSCSPVHRKSTNGHHVPWKWRESRTPPSTGQDLLHAHEVQRVYDVVQRVRPLRRLAFGKRYCTSPSTILLPSCLFVCLCANWVDSPRCFI